MNEIFVRLNDLRDEKYGNFCAKLTPTIPRDRFIGVRTPELRRLAKELVNEADIFGFLDDLPHKYYEENNLHGSIISFFKDYGKCVAAVEKFLPYIDNWATCDMLRPAVFGKHLPELEVKIREWIVSDKVFTVRFGVEMLMNFYLDKHFKPEYLDLVAGIHSDEYYINMMTAWFFATALAKQYDATLPFIEQKRLDTWTHNKTIQKAVESFRITDEQKKYLKLLKIKNN